MERDHKFWSPIVTTLIKLRLAACLATSLLLPLAGVEDAYEENDDLGSAKALALGTHSLHCADDDFFQVSLEAGLAWIRLEHPTGTGGALAVVLKNAAGTDIAANLVNDGTEEFHYHVLTGGTYHVRVYKEDPALADNDYTLTVAQQRSVAGDDGREEDDSLSTAKAVDGVNSSTVATALDEDWFSVTAEGTGDLAIDCQFTPAAGNIDLYVYDTAGTLLTWNIQAIHGAAGANGRTLSFTPTPEASYRIACVGTGGNTYTLLTSQTVVSEDGYEDNDSRQTAPPLAFGTHTGLGLLDDDWYRIGSAEAPLLPGLLAIRLEPSARGAAYDLNVVLYDSAGNAIASDPQNQAAEQIAYHVGAPGYFFVHVLKAASGDNDYSLTVSRSLTHAGDDDREDNDDLASASLLAAANTTLSDRISHDEDWYRVEADGTGPMTVTVSSLTAAPAFEVYNSAGTLLTRHVGGSTTGRQISFDINVDRTVYIAALATGGAVYSLVTSQVVISEDGHEDNDTRATAATLTAGTHSLAAKDDDWFRIDFSEPGQVLVGLEHPSYGAVADLNLVLVAADGSEIASDLKTDAAESIRYHLTAAATLYARITRSGGHDNSYTLTIGRESSQANDDAQEPNDHLSAATAIALNQTLSGLIARDEDWYAVSATGSGQLTVACDYTVSAGNLDLEIYDPSGNLVTRSTLANDGAASGTGRSVTVDINDQRDYRICVVGSGGLAYSLTTSQSVFSEDGHEDNDSRETAATLGFGSHALAAFDDDWFAFAVDGPGLLHVRLEHPSIGAVGDLNAVLFASDGSEIASAFQTDASEVFRYHVVTGGTYYVRVSKNGTQDNTYTLTVGRDLDVPGDDAREGDDSFAAATVATINTPLLGLVAADEDWFRFEASGSGPVTVAADFDVNGANLDIEVYHSNQTRVSRDTLDHDGAATGAGRSVTVDVDTERTFYVAVIGSGSATYSLRLEQATISEDGHEDNDSKDAAKALDFGDHGLACFDEDWYRFDFAEPGLFHVRMSHPAIPAGDLNLEIHNDTEVVASDNDTNRTEELFYHVIVPGSYYVRVFKTGTQDNSYSLTVEREYTAQDDDAREEDDIWSQATALPGFNTEVTGGIARDEDWFTVTVPAGTLTVRLLYDNAGGELDLEVYGQDRQRDGDAEGDEGVISGGKELLVDFDHPEQIRIAVVGRTGASYRLVLEHPVQWYVGLDAGPINASSPLLVDLDGDGQLEILIGAQKGMDASGAEIRRGALFCLEHDGSVKWRFDPPAHGSADPVTGLTYQTTGVGTRPAVGDLDGDGDLEVVFGVGADLLYMPRKDQDNEAPYDPGHKGGVYALDHDGQEVWFRASHDIHGFEEASDGLTDAVYASPVIGDIDGDGLPEVSWGGWDHYAFLVDGRTGLDYQAGDNRSQWPVNQHDTIWTTPLMADIDEDGVLNLIFGGDITTNAAARTVTGGILHVYNRFGLETVTGFRDYITFPGERFSFTKGKYLEQTLWSSPIAADIDNDGHLELATGTGLFYEDPIGQYVKLWNHDGSEYGVLTTNGRPFASPLFADLTGDGDLEIIAVTANGYVHGWEHDGGFLFATQTSPFGGLLAGATNSTTTPELHPIYGSPLAFDLDGDNTLEIVYQQGNTVVVVDHLGTQLTSIERVGMHNESFRGTPAIADLDGDGIVDIVTGGSDKDVAQGFVYCFRWQRETGNSDGRYARRMFRESGVVPMPQAQRDRRAEVVAFVTRFYRMLLGREPEAAGLASWVTQILEGERAAGEIGRGFVLSPEFINLGLDDEAFVRALYSAFFNRTADQGGLDGWLALLAGGGTRAEVMEGFIGAQEFINLANTFGVTPFFTVFNGPNRVLVEEFVTRLYHFILDRSPDDGGLANWTNALLAGTVVGEEAAGGFVFGPEFLARGLSDEEFVRTLYRSLFGRSADPGGLTAWLDEISRIRSDPVAHPPDFWTDEQIWRHVFSGFINSQEFSNLATFYGIIPRLQDG